MQDSSNGSTRRERRHFTGQQKAAIVKSHLVDRVPISDLCEQHQIQLAQFYQWQKQLFENGIAAFERKNQPSGPSPQERKIAHGTNPFDIGIAHKLF
jgi:transposase-like protein